MDFSELLARKKMGKDSTLKRERPGGSKPSTTAKRQKVAAGLGSELASGPLSDRRHRSQADQSSWEQRRSGFSNRPVSRPFEAPGQKSVRLNFNYWMQSQSPVLIKDIRQLVAYSLAEESTRKHAKGDGYFAYEFLNQMPSVQSIVFVLLSGVHPLDIRRALAEQEAKDTSRKNTGTGPQESACQMQTIAQWTSIPVCHSNNGLTIFECERSEMRNRVHTCAELFFTCKKPPVDMAKLKLAEMLSKYTVVYQAEHSRWSGLVLTLPSGRFSQCKGERMATATEVGSWKLQMLPLDELPQTAQNTWNGSDPICDSLNNGQCARLTLMWDKWAPEILDTTDGGRFFKRSATDAANSHQSMFNLSRRRAVETTHQSDDQEAKRQVGKIGDGDPDSVQKQQVYKEEMGSPAGDRSDRHNESASIQSKRDQSIECVGKLQDYCMSMEEMCENGYPTSEGRPYIHTIAKRTKGGQGSESKQPPLSLLGIDCEMVVTSVGYELARVTVVDISGTSVYDELVLPPNPVTDYVTKYSGITEEMMKGVKTTLAEVQQNLLSLLYADSTILVGHSLESDLHALKIVHPLAIDTAILFPDASGRPFKRSLRVLTKKFLGEDIQDNEELGHDSAEDAVCALRLALLKMRHGPMFGLPTAECALDSESFCNVMERTMIKGKASDVYSPRHRVAVVTIAPSTKLEEDTNTCSTGTPHVWTNFNNGINDCTDAHLHVQKEIHCRSNATKIGKVHDTVVPSHGPMSAHLIADNSANTAEEVIDKIVGILQPSTGQTAVLGGETGADDARIRQRKEPPTFVWTELLVQSDDGPPNVSAPKISGRSQSGEEVQDSSEHHRRSEKAQHKQIDENSSALTVPDKIEAGEMEEGEVEEGEVEEGEVKEGEVEEGEVEEGEVEEGGVWGGGGAGSGKQRGARSGTIGS